MLAQSAGDARRPPGRSNHRVSGLQGCLSDVDTHAATRTGDEPNSLLTHDFTLYGRVRTSATRRRPSRVNAPTRCCCHTRPVSERYREDHTLAEAGLLP